MTCRSRKATTFKERVIEAQKLCDIAYFSRVDLCFVVPRTCNACGDEFQEELESATGPAREEDSSVCLYCDPESNGSSAVTRTNRPH